VNYYLDGIAGITGLLIALPIYKTFKIRWTFIFAFTFALFWSIMLLIFE